MAKTEMAPTTSFFADDDFVQSLERPAGGQYLNPSKIQDGQTVRFRIVSPSAVTGFEVWTEENRPLRFRERPSADKLPANVRRNKNGAPDIKQFLAALVFSYEEDQFKLALFTQKSILQGIAQYAKDEDYGHPNRYDLVLGRTGAGMETKYNLLPKPPKDIDASIVDRLDSFYCRLEALFDSEDPFQEPAF